MDRLTIPEYMLLMEAVRLKQVDRSHEIHMQAWLTFAAKATKGRGKNVKPVFSKFKLFFNYEKEIEKANNPDNGKEKGKFPGIGQVFKKKGE